MNDKERYYKLDDLLPIGTQKKLSPKQEKALAKETGKFIAAIKKAEAARKSNKAS